MYRAFVAMPFAQQFYPIYEVIKEACDSLNIKPIRIDEVWAREDIYEEIEKEILKADFMITDFTGDRMLDVPNPNVVHEAAFARTHKKYLILMAQDHQCLPFDWRTRPALIYTQDEKGLTYLKDRLITSIKALMQRDDFGTDNQSFIQPQMFNPNMQYQNNPVMPFNQNMNSNFIQNSNNNLQNQYEPISLIENLIRTKERNIVPENIEKASLPPGFKEKNKKIISQIDEREMVLISQDLFMMGAEDSDEDQKPVHEVTLSDYLIDVYPVTNKDYIKFMNAGGYSFKGYWSDEAWRWRCKYNIEGPIFLEDNLLNHPEQPVVGISWYEAMAYSVWAGKHLPTEAQWEFAAKGKNTKKYPWGNDEPDETKANYRGVHSSTTNVGKFKSNISCFGCYDMLGNVWEWCYDWYNEDYYLKSPTFNPAGPISGDEKVCRGGSWTYDIDTLTTCYRFWGAINLRDRGYGFRCARTL